MWNKLSIRLTGILLGVFTATAVGFYGLASSLNDHAMLEATQSLNKPLAQYIAFFVQSEKDVPTNLEILRQKFAEHMQVNPATEIYLIHPNGEVQLFHPTEYFPELQRIDLEPIVRYLKPDARLPILGDDPRSVSESKIFSAAVLPPPFDPGSYLYIILGGEQYRQQFAEVNSRYHTVMAVSAAFLAGIAALLTVTLLYFTLTRRIERLAHRMTVFDPSAVSSELHAPRDPPEEHADELSRLEVSFHAMAQRIVQQLNEIAAIDVSRRRFITSVAHDIRVPLTTIQGQLDYLASSPNGSTLSQVKECALTALSATKRLTGLTADLYELAQLEDPHVPVSKEPFPIDELVSDIVQEFIPVARKQGVDIQLMFAEENATVIGNIALLQRTLANLLDNALNHAKNGKRIEVAVERTLDRVRILVSDNGEGIPDDELANVFEPFFRGAGNLSTIDGGLGLAIAAQIVNLHNGRIYAMNRAAGGAEFCIELPISVPGLATQPLPTR